MNKTTMKFKTRAALVLAACVLLFAWQATPGQTGPAAPPATKPSAAASAQTQPWTKIPIPPLHAFKP